MPKTSTPDQQKARRKLAKATVGIKTLEDLNLAIAVIEAIKADPDRVKALFGNANYRG